MNRLVRLQAAMLSLLAVLMLSLTAPTAQAGPKPTSINVIPTVTNLTIGNGQLIASGVATAVIHGKTYTTPFTAPVTFSTTPNASDPDCPILNLHLGPINLDLLGLVVKTSQICLAINGDSGNGNLLGNLLCDIANLLNGGLNLNQILSSLNTSDLNTVLSGLTGILNGALQQLSQAVLQSITMVDQRHTCSILHLSLGPLNLDLLGLDVTLDNCANGPVTVDITAVTGKGNLLGNLLCGLVDGNLLNLGSTLQQILNQLTGLLTA